MGHGSKRVSFLSAQTYPFDLLLAGRFENICMINLATLSTKIEEPRVVVKINGSLFYKPNNHSERKGNLSVGWIFGGVEKGDHSKSFIVLAPKRS
ncbi:hypothetical protein HZS_7281 [Henneguya salminicola]|nr:hypothetical protein HZS_7281 [Henneguya salminicola]